jgi:hypothetical protein
MNARITALTHFSARYPKVHATEPITIVASSLVLLQVPKFAEHRNVFFAFDFSVLYPGESPPCDAEAHARFLHVI